MAERETDRPVASPIGVLVHDAAGPGRSTPAVTRTLLGMTSALALSKADELEVENLEVNELPEADALSGEELVAIDQGGVTVKVLLSDLADYIKVAESIVPASEPFKGVLLERTGLLSSVSFPAFIPWQAAVYDTDSFWSAGAATRITIPAGITKVRLTGAWRGNPVKEAGSLACRIQKNGGFYKFSMSNITRQGEIGFDDNVSWSWTPVIPVDPGDFFELRINRADMTTVTDVFHGFSTFFSLEVIERD